MTLAISMVVIILTLSQPAQTFRQQPQKRHARMIAKEKSKAPIQEAPIPSTDKGAAEEKILAPIKQTPPVQEASIRGAGDKTVAQIQRGETPELSRWEQLRAHVFGENKTVEDAAPQTSEMISEMRSGTDRNPGDPAYEFHVGVYDITASTLSHPVQVRSGIELSSSLITSLGQEGINAVTVVKVEYHEADGQVRALIESPAGWISLLDTRNGFRWAENRAAFCRYRPLETCEMGGDKCYVFAFDCMPQKLTIHVQPQGWSEDQVFPLGTYDLLEEARVNEGPHLDSKQLFRFGDLAIGEAVNVLKIEYVPTETRVRAQIEQPPKGVVGWISLLDTSDNFRWAQNRASFCATNVESRFGLYRVKWCEWNEDKCYWDQEAGACIAKPYPSEEYLASTSITTTVDPKYVIIKATTPEPGLPETPGRPSGLPKTPGQAGGGKKGKEAPSYTPGKDTSDTPDGVTPEAPPKPESPEPAGKDSAARRSAGTCAMAVLLLLLCRFHVSL